MSFSWIRFSGMVMMGCGVAVYPTGYDAVRHTDITGTCISCCLLILCGAALLAIREIANV